MSKRPWRGPTSSALYGKISSGCELSEIEERLTDSDYKSSLPSQTDALLQDRGRIDSSHRMMDDTLK